jgi:putative peptide zinc metalloprotease protein
MPQLRAELEFCDGGHDGNGETVVIVHDPLRHRFFRLPQGAVAHFATVAQGGAASPGPEAEEVMQFALQARLMETAGSTGLLQEYERSKQGILAFLLHHYLSFRVHLINPEGFLDFALPVARMLVSRLVITLVLLSGAVGLYFALLQWEHFRATFIDFFTPAGAALYGATLVGLKVFHELGHGFTARHFGCRVPSMGVNFMVLTPMLFTEASDAWRLASRRQRFLIGAAGVLTELALASLALLLWAFLPDGPLRSACYFVAATAWVTSLAVNLSPFMRFDGYHMLTDITGLHGLGGRAFALFRWRIREVLFGQGGALPEFFPRRKEWALLAFACGTCLYRLGLFLGIAYTVLHMFPKLVGLPLAWIEVQWFILNPIIRELKEWRAMGLSQVFARPRAFVSLSVLAGLVGLAALPLDRHVAIPAVLLPAREARVFAPEAARVVAVHVTAGQAVEEGAVLLELEQPDLAFRQRSAVLRLAMAEERLARSASDRGALSQRQASQQEVAVAQDELRGLAQRKSRLRLVAPFSGRVSTLAEGLQAGQWVNSQQLLLHIYDDGGAAAQGLMAEMESARLAPGAIGYFVAERGEGAARPVRLQAIGLPGAEGMAALYLSSSHGGAVSMAAAPGSGRVKAIDGVLPVQFAADRGAPPQAMRGTISVEAAPRSLLARAFARVVSVALRESGF